MSNRAIRPAPSSRCKVDETVDSGMDSRVGAASSTEPDRLTMTVTLVFGSPHQVVTADRSRPGRPRPVSTQSQQT